jgi:hypothetical protein
VSDRQVPEHNQRHMDLGLHARRDQIGTRRFVPD